MNSAALALPIGGKTMLGVGGRNPKVVCPMCCHILIYLHQPVTPVSSLTIKLWAAPLEEQV